MEVIVMWFHTAVNLLHALRGVFHFDVFSNLWSQARRLCEIFVERPAIPPAVFGRIAAGFPCEGFFDEGDTDAIAELGCHLHGVFQKIVAVNHRWWRSI